MSKSKNKHELYHMIELSARSSFKELNNVVEDVSTSVTLKAYDNPKKGEADNIYYTQLLESFDNIIHTLGYGRTDIAEEKWNDFLRSCNFSEVLDAQEKIKEGFESKSDAIDFIIENLSVINKSTLRNLILKLACLKD